MILGASNVTRSIATIVRAVEDVTPGPVDFLIACGHGRSYGQSSSVLGRTLPGILPCGLWRALQSAPTLPTRALITDVGNDLLYGASVDEIVAWVDRCLASLRSVDARVVLTGLPMASLARLSSWRFAILSRVFFPMHDVRFESLLESAVKLDAALRRLAEKHQATWVAPEGEWYGFDPIHIRRRVWEAAWKKFFSSWGEMEISPNRSPRNALAHWLFLKRMRPEQRRILGVARRTTQPAGVLPHGSRVSMY